MSAAQKPTKQKKEKRKREKKERERRRRRERRRGRSDDNKMKMIGAKNASVRARVCKGSPLVRRRTPNTRYVAPQKKKLGAKRG